MKRVMIVGAGGREHQLALTYLQSEQVGEVLVTPGNCGMVGNKINPDFLNIKIDGSSSLKDSESIIRVAKKYQPDLIDVAQDDALAAGTVDLLQEHGFRVFGPTQAAAEIESNKVWARNFMKKYNLPTPQYKSFRAGDREAISYAQGLLEQSSAKEPVVFFKANGLFAGKGVIPVTKDNLEEAFSQMSQIGKAAETFLVEEGLVGEEFSYYALADGKNYVCFNSAQDNKRVFNRDQGPNTGGMGANSPALVTRGFEKRIEEEILRPIVQGMAKEGRPFTGIVYLGGMLSPEGQLQIVEFNARWGDPEVHVVLPALQNDYFELVQAALDKRLNEIEIKQDNLTRVCVIGASAGYPEDYSQVKGKIVYFEKENIPCGTHLLSAGLKHDGINFLAAGGRLFSVVSSGKNIIEAGQKSLKTLAHCQIEDNGLHYRTDVGWRDVQRIQNQKRADEFKLNSPEIKEEKEDQKTEEIKPLYSGRLKDFVWVGFGSGSGTNLAACAKVIKPKLIFSDRKKASLLNLEIFNDVPKLVLNGYNFCGSWKKAQGNPVAEAKYEQKSVEFNELILQKLKEFEEQIGKPIDLIVLGGYMRLVKEPLLLAYKDRMINVHPANLSILKEGKRVYVGDNAVLDAVRAGEKNTCSSVILVDEGVDNGEILTQGESVQVSEDFLSSTILDQVEKEEKLREYADSHQDQQKIVSDWPALTTALKLIAEGRLALGTTKNSGGWRKVYVDGQKMEYRGFKASVLAT